MAKTIGLDGQGISALFGDQNLEENYFECSISQIIPNKHQPRSAFDQDQLVELADSIRVHGVIQPLIVSRISKKKFGLVAGERRLRASKLAGLKTVPVVVREVLSEDELLAYALIENIQRTDLNPLEEAQAFKKLAERFGFTQDEIARKIGKNRSTVANALRLLQLPEFVKEDLLAGLLTEGHARTLLPLITVPATLKEIRDQVISGQLSVRQTEKLVKSHTQEPKQAAIRLSRKKEKEFSRSVCKSLENQLTNKLSSQVVINQKGSRGKIEIAYYSYDDLERIIDLVLTR